MIPDIPYFNVVLLSSSTETDSGIKLAQCVECSKRGFICISNSMGFKCVLTYWSQVLIVQASIRDPASTVGRRLFEIRRLLEVLWVHVK